MNGWLMFSGFRNGCSRAQIVQIIFCAVPLELHPDAGMKLLVIEDGDRMARTSLQGLRGGRLHGGMRSRCLRCRQRIRENPYRIGFAFSILGRKGSRDRVH